MSWCQYAQGGSLVAHRARHTASFTLWPRQNSEQLRSVSGTLSPLHWVITDSKNFPSLFLWRSHFFFWSVNCLTATCNSLILASCAITTLRRDSKKKTNLNRNQNTKIILPLRHKLPIYLYYILGSLRWGEHNKDRYYACKYLFPILRRCLSLLVKN